MFNIKDLDIMQSTLLTTNPLCASFIQDRKEILGELQFAFVCFLVGQGIDSNCVDEIQLVWGPLWKI